jgi:hypothetical protein
MRPQPRMQNKSEHTSVVTTVTPKNARHSPRNGFNAYIVLSPVTGLSCHRRRRSCLHRLDSSVGASGPHDFAVRSRHHSSTDVACVHCIPLPTFVTTAKRPSYRVRDGENVPVICGQDQSTPPAAEWHDGQFAYGRHARSARRANQWSRLSKLAMPALVSTFASFGGLASAWAGWPNGPRKARPDDRRRRNPPFYCSA